MTRTLRFIFELAFWMVAAGAVLLGVAVLGGLGFSPVIGFVGLAALLLLFPLSLRIATQSRLRGAAMIVSYLEQAVRLNLPLPKMLRAAQLSETGTEAVRLAAVRQHLEDGLPVGAALELGAPEVSDRTVAIVAAAERAGTLPKALRRALDENALRSQQDALDMVFQRFYPPLLLLAVTLLISMLSVFVLPKFEAIFRDFKSPMPPITVLTLRLAGSLAPFVLIVASLWILGFAGRAIGEMLHPQRIGQTVLHAAAQHVAWRVPLLHSLARDRGLADLLDFLAGAVESGMPMDKGLLEGTTLMMNIVLKDRVAQWAKEVADGRPVHEAARDSRMPELVWGMLGTARHREDAANVLRFLSRYYGSRFSRTAALVNGATIPVIVLIFGVIVGIVALSLFLPMVSLIENMSSTPLNRLMAI